MRGKRVNKIECLDNRMLVNRGFAVSGSFLHFICSTIIYESCDLETNILFTKMGFGQRSDWASFSAIICESCNLQRRLHQLFTPRLVLVTWQSSYFFLISFKRRVYRKDFLSLSKRICPWIKFNNRHVPLSKKKIIFFLFFSQSLAMMCYVVN